jgi:hypothetical protein
MRGNLLVARDQIHNNKPLYIYWQPHLCLGHGSFIFEDNTIGTSTENPFTHMSPTRMSGNFRSNTSGLSQIQLPIDFLNSGCFAGEFTAWRSKGRREAFYVTGNSTDPVKFFEPGYEIGHTVKLIFTGAGQRTIENSDCIKLKDGIDFTMQQPGDMLELMLWKLDTPCDTSGTIVSGQWIEISRDTAVFFCSLKYVFKYL